MPSQLFTTCVGGSARASAATRTSFRLSTFAGFQRSPITDSRPAVKLSPSAAKASILTAPQRAQRPGEAVAAPGRVDHLVDPAAGGGGVRCQVLGRVEVGELVPGGAGAGREGAAVDD